MSYSWYWPEWGINTKTPARYTLLRGYSIEIIWRGYGKFLEPSPLPFFPVNPPRHTHIFSNTPHIMEGGNFPLYPLPSVGCQECWFQSKCTIFIHLYIFLGILQFVGFINLIGLHGNGLYGFLVRKKNPYTQKCCLFFIISMNYCFIKVQVYIFLSWISSGLRVWWVAQL